MSPRVAFTGACMLAVSMILILIFAPKGHAAPTRRRDLLQVTPHATITDWECVGGETYQSAVIDVSTYTDIGASWQYGYYTWTDLSTMQQHVEAVVMVPTGNVLIAPGPRWSIDVAQPDEPFHFSIPHEAHFAWKRWDTTDDVRVCR